LRDFLAEIVGDGLLGVRQMRRQREQRRRQHCRRIDVERAHDGRRAGGMIGERLARRQARIARVLAHERERVVERRRWVRSGRDGVGVHRAAARGIRGHSGECLKRDG